MTIPKIPPYALPDLTTLPVSRASWQLEARRAALLVHDMQEYFLNFYDRTQSPYIELAERTETLVRAARERGVPVLYTAQPGVQEKEDRGLLTDLWGPGITAFPEQTPILASLTPLPNETVLTKWRYSAFQRSELRKILEQLGRDQLAITGVYAHIGCLLTASEAFMQDVQPFLVADAVADFSKEKHEMALRHVAECSGRVTVTAQVLRDWELG